MSNETKVSGHTPGPWFCGRAIRGGQECIIGDGDSVVAFMPDRTIECSFIREDALLIAAAPKMLEALQAILPWIPISSADEGGASKYSENVRAADKARAAIAAATGETK